MIHDTCPCCCVSVLPHSDGCVFEAECPIEAEHFAIVADLKARVAELEARVVRLPRPINHPWNSWEAGYDVMLKAARHRLDAAGVKWEEE